MLCLTLFFNIKLILFLVTHRHQREREIEESAVCRAEVMQGGYNLNCYTEDATIIT